MFLKLLIIFVLILSETYGSQILEIIFKDHFHQCGIMSESTGLIQGGKFSKQSQFPWIAIISVKKESQEWDQNGSGSLISKRHVFVKPRYVATLDEDNKYIAIPQENVEVYLGTTKYGDLSQTGSMKVGVSKIKLYPNARKLELGFSILNLAIVTLEHDVVYSEYIQPVCLWNNNLNSKIYTGQQMMAVGYGRDLSGQISKIRKHVPVQTTNATECGDEYGYAMAEMYESSFFCVKEVLKDQGPCSFDTQLYVKIGPVWYLRGEMVTTRIDPDTKFCEVSFPIAVEDIGPYSNWIHKRVNHDLIEAYALNIVN